ncbi:MAG: DM13 domain-containing protein [Sphingobacteriaceae bacterium]|nr:DM13 domain-containing protein [Cytophagaceae bacterium]
MKKLLFTLLLPLALVACQKNPDFTIVDEPLPVNNGTNGTSPIPSEPITQTKGVFMNGVHSTSGKVSVVKDAEGKERLSFENFKTDSGPDLRVYLAENTGAKNFIEIDRLTKLGTFSLPLPLDANPAQRKHVLIWCRSYSVLFGSAELQ